jgi:hypothetical protein
MTDQKAKNNHLKFLQWPKRLPLFLLREKTDLQAACNKQARGQELPIRLQWLPRRSEWYGMGWRLRWLDWKPECVFWPFRMQGIAFNKA